MMTVRREVRAFQAHQEFQGQRSVLGNSTPVVLEISGKSPPIIGIVILKKSMGLGMS